MNVHAVRTTFVVALAACMWQLAMPAYAVKFWKNSVTTGNWNTGNNWSATSAASADNGGVPVASESVRIVHTNGVAHTVTLDTSPPTLGALAIDLTGAGATTNTLLINSNVNLTAANINVGGHTGTAATNGRGAINQSAGSVTSTAGLDIAIGNGAGSNGTYTLGGGALTVPQSLYVGLNGTGTFHHSGGTNTILAGAVGALDLGAFAGSVGTYNLSGSGQLITSKSIYVGDNGTGVFNHTGGLIDIMGSGSDLQLGFGSTGNGTYNISNNAGVFVPDSLVIGASGMGTFNIHDQAAVGVGTLSINASSNLNLNGGTLSLNTVTSSSASRVNWNAGKIFLSGDRDVFVDGAASTLFRVDFGAGIGAGKHGEVGGMATFDGSLGNTFDIKDGGKFSSREGRIGYGPLKEGTVNVTGPGSVWNVGGAGALIVGNEGIGGTLNIRNGGLVTGDVRVIVDTNGAVNLDGGTLRFNDLNPNGGDGVFNFYSGTVQLTRDRAIGSDNTIMKIFGAAPTLTSGKELSIEGAATLLSVVTLDGGTLTAPSIVNGNNLSLLRGKLNITNQAVTIGSGGLLGSTLDLNDDMTINVNGGITNQGLVTGDGQLGGSFTNAAAGELRGEPGKSLKLTGIGNNSGQVNLHGGLIEFTSNLNNQAGAFISGNGTLKAGQLANIGTMNFAGTANIVATVNNVAGGKVISGGGGATIFYGDVLNNGEIRTSTNGFTVFFGSVSGSGTFTGTGTVNFEGDLNPGSSPGIVNFAGDVVLGAESTLAIELGGLTAGTQHDKLSIAGDLVLDGVLEVSLINGFTPTAGQSFNILDWGSIAGTFSSIVLPSLSGLAWNTSQLYTQGILSLASAGVPGDYNQNGTVDAADYTLWRDRLGSGTALPNDDTAGVGPDDYTRWKSNFGNLSGTGATTAAVPEPAVSLLALCGLFCIPARRRMVRDNR